MALSEGARIGAYQVIDRLGVGGMGEVYRARDTKLNRDVAIKILIPALANDRDQLARFTQEAHVLASLNHPQIAHIHGLEDSDGVRALVMELVVGPTLAERLEDGPFSIEESLDVARQIAEALASAHECGVVHRDLKPANIKVRPDGTVKVLDFGLAKAFEPLGSSSRDAAAAVTSPAVTRLGTILGTAAYMSPEQARGQAVDKRTDIWAFGCVLYEMLTARRAFPGETISDTIAAVIDRGPDWTRLPAATPPGIRRLLERSLEKPVNRRLHDIADARIEIDDAIAGKESEALVAAAAPSLAGWRIAAGALAVIATVFGYLALAPSERASANADRFMPFAFERQQQLSPSSSPDGRSIAYVAAVDDVRQLFVKSLDAAMPTQLTRSGSDCRSPFWSPDGTRVFYVMNRKLWSIGAAGGEPQPMIDDVAAAAIAPGGAMVLIRGSGGKQTLWLAPPSGAPAPYRRPPFPEQFTRSNSIAFSRDGSKIAVLVEHQAGAALTFELWILPYATGAPRRALGPFQSPTNPFDLGRVSWMGDNRHLILQNTPPDEQSWHLHLVDTDTGNVRPITSGIGAEWTPAASPDGRRIAFASGLPDLDIVQVSIDSGETRPLLATGRNEMAPSWSPSGTRFAYLTTMNGRFEVWLHNILDGSSTPVLRRGLQGVPPWSTLERAAFSPDGQKVAYGAIQSDRHAIWVSAVAGGQPVPIDSESVDQHGASWSPDSNAIAYQRLRGDQWELVKAPLGGGTIVRLASGDPGAGPTAWSPDGDWLAYVRAGALHLVSPADGSIDRILNTPLPVAFTFSRDGTLLYALHRNAHRNWEIVALDVRTGAERKTQALQIPPSSTVAGLSLHPDGRSFITSIGSSRLDLWVLERAIPELSWWRSLLRIE